MCGCGRIGNLADIGIQTQQHSPRIEQTQEGRHRDFPALGVGGARCVPCDPKECPSLLHGQLGHRLFEKPPEYAEMARIEAETALEAESID